MEAEEQKNCNHAGYLMQNGALLCTQCGEPSQSEKWKANVFGSKALEQTENKGRFWPSESKRGPGRPRSKGA